jgi:beta-glucosidase/6-phospho-beta-glucosidase/beta-galactosidase
MKRNLIPLLLGAFVFYSCPHDSGSYDPVTSVRSFVPEDFMGMVHAGSRAEAAAEYALLDEMGVKWMLTDFSWSTIEPANDDWQWNKFDGYVKNANDHGKKVLAILDYDVGWIHDGTYTDDFYSPGDAPYISPSEIPLFCDYVKNTVSRYRGKVGAWCIWNEPNLSSRFWSGTKIVVRAF